MRFAMHTPDMEGKITFPVIPGIDLTSPDRYAAMGLYTPFHDLGVAALSGIGNPGEDISRHSKSALEFLASVSRFVRGPVHDGVDWGSTEPGDHTFLCDLSKNPKAGLAVARTAEDRLSGTEPEYPIKSIFVEYHAEEQTPVGSIGVYMELTDHPRFEARYVRFSGTRSAGEDYASSDKLTLRVALGHLTYRGMPEPDELSTFGALEQIGVNLAELHGQRILGQ